MKKLFDFLLTLVIVIIVGIWVYRLSMTFQSLPRGENLSYIYFIVELWIFTFFLIASGIVVLWTWNTEQQKTENSQELAREVKRLSLLLDRKDFQLQQPKTDEFDVRKLEMLLRPLRASTPAEWAIQLIEGCFVLCGARRISVFVKRDDDVVLEKSMGLPDARVGQKLAHKDLAFQMFQRQKRLFVTEIETHPEIARPNRIGYASHSFLIIPITTYQHEALGVINLTEKENASIFTQTELDMVCHLVAIASYRLKTLLQEDGKL